VLPYRRPIAEIIERRFSCRTYAPGPIQLGLRDELSEFLAASGQGPLGTRVRFELVSASEEDLAALKGLGTYGFIKGASGFIIGAVGPGERNLEDYGYLLEGAILFATDLGLGTCWLGATFDRSAFSRKISLQEGETIPAVAALGYVAERRRWLDSYIRRRAGSDDRLPWSALFFDRDFANPLSVEKCGPFVTPLQMVRLAPSASNRQPWRIVKDGSQWHFYLRRSRNLSNRSLSILKLADLQRIDMGIAMCHFQLTAKEMGLSGEWKLQDPGINQPDPETEYIVTWQGSD
jgi:hypothetical protein